MFEELQNIAKQQFEQRIKSVVIKKVIIFGLPIVGKLFLVLLAVAVIAAVLGRFMQIASPFVSFGSSGGSISDDDPSYEMRVISDKIREFRDNRDVLIDGTVIASLLMDLDEFTIDESADEILDDPDRLTSLSRRQVNNYVDRLAEAQVELVVVLYCEYKVEYDAGGTGETQSVTERIRIERESDCNQYQDGEVIEEQHWVLVSRDVFEKYVKEEYLPDRYGKNYDELDSNERATIDQITSVAMDMELAIQGGELHSIPNSFGTRGSRTITTEPIPNSILNKLIFPMKNGEYRFNWCYGYYGRAECNRHFGVDYGPIPHDTQPPIRAVYDGVVVSQTTETRNCRSASACRAAGIHGAGMSVLIQHTFEGFEDTFYSVYVHLSRFEGGGFSQGDIIRQGQILGDLGDTGHSTGPHLHFEFGILDSGHRHLMNPEPLNEKDGIPSVNISGDHCDYVRSQCTVGGVSHEQS